MTTSMWVKTWSSQWQTACSRRTIQVSPRSMTYQGLDWMSISLREGRDQLSIWMHHLKAPNNWTRDCRRRDYTSSQSRTTLTIIRSSKCNKIREILRRREMSIRTPTWSMPPWRMRASWQQPISYQSPFSSPPTREITQLSSIRDRNRMSSQIVTYFRGRTLPSSMSQRKVHISKKTELVRLVWTTLMGPTQDTVTTSTMRSMEETNRPIRRDTATQDSKPPQTCP